MPERGEGSSPPARCMSRLRAPRANNYACAEVEKTVRVVHAMHGYETVRGVGTGGGLRGPGPPFSVVRSYLIVHA